MGGWPLPINWELCAARGSINRSLLTELGALRGVRFYKQTAPPELARPPRLTGLPQYTTPTTPTTPSATTTPSTPTTPTTPTTPSATVRAVP